MKKQDLIIEQPKSLEVFMNRLRMLESNTNRLVNQHQALLPLISLLKLIPQVNKHKQQLRLLQSQLESKCSSLKQFHISVKEGSSKQMALNIKQLNNQINQTRSRLKQLQQKTKKQGKQQLYRTRIRTTTINKAIQSNLQQLKKDVIYFITDFKETLGNDYKKQMTQSQCVQKYISERLKDSETQFRSHSINLKRQIGLLQCGLEFLKDRQLRRQLKKQKSQLKNQSVMATVQYSFCMTNLYQFEQSNTDRLRYQLQVLQSDLKRVPNIKSLQKKGAQLCFCKQKYRSLQNEIQGSRLKGMGDVMRLQNKLQRLKTFQSEIEINKQQNQLRQIKQINAKHIKLLQQQTSTIQEKFKQIQKYI